MADPTTGVSRIDVQDLKRNLDSIFVVDVRRHSWQDSPVKIKGAHRYEADDLLNADRVDLPISKATPIVTYCT